MNTRNIMITSVITQVLIIVGVVFLVLDSLPVEYGIEGKTLLTVSA